MEPEGILLCPHEDALEPLTKTAESSPRLLTLRFTKTTSSNWWAVKVSRLKFHTHFTSLSCVPHKELNTSWETAGRSATQEFPNMLCNPKVHYRVHKSPALLPIVSQTNSVHTTPVYFSKIHFNIILSSTSISHLWSLSFWVANQSPICIPSLSCMLHALPISSSLT
jgi:hypothetical protein